MASCCSASLVVIVGEAEVERLVGDEPPEEGVHVVVQLVVRLVNVEG
jgi:hypothetical protein